MEKVDSEMTELNDIKRVLKNTEEYATMLENALQQAKDALTRVTDLVFEDEMAKYENGKLTQGAKDAIEQYQDMVNQCEDALKAVQMVLPTPTTAAA
jgi:hypothetical protein